MAFHPGTPIPALEFVKALGLPTDMNITKVAITAYINDLVMVEVAMVLDKKQDGPLGEVIKKFKLVPIDEA